MIRSRSLNILALFVGALLSACGGGGGASDASSTSGTGGTTSGTGVGTLLLSMTDAPACYQQVNVTVERVRIHESADAADGDPGWSELVLSPPRRIDLAHLTNGSLEDLGRVTLPAGTYTQMRLVLVDNTTSDPLANSVKPYGGTEVPLKTPSGQQSGLKLNIDLVVPEGQVAHLVLDFDACKSVVKAGKSGKYLLKPVLSAVAVLTEAGQKVRGCVASTLSPPNTDVSLQRSGVPVKATVPDSEGCFVLYPVPVGTYDLVVASPGHATAVMTGVPVDLDHPTIVSTKGLPIDPPTSLSRDVAGVVTPADATVRALQTLTGGPTVEVRRADVDADDGSFVMSLPISAPWRTSYLRIDPLQLPPTLGFASDLPVAGLYTVEARKLLAVETQDIDGRNAVPPLRFDLN